jgi:hypothetical protein
MPLKPSDILPAKPLAHGLPIKGMTGGQALNDEPVLGLIGMRLGVVGHQHELLSDAGGLVETLQQQYCRALNGPACG